MSEKEGLRSHFPMTGSVPQELSFTPQEPLARPSHPARPSGTVRAVYQICEEHFALSGEVQATNKPELDMTAFVKAIAAAFPEPRDPVGRPILPPRPERAARPLWFVEGGVTEEAIPDLSADAAGNSKALVHPSQMSAPFHEGTEDLSIEAAGLRSFSDRPLVKPVLEAAASMMMDLPYDPILEDAHSIFPSHNPVRVAAVTTSLQSHERELIEAIVEPLEPVAKPGFPTRPSTPLPGVQPRLTPSQRAQINRPAVLRDRNGQLAPVTYSVHVRRSHLESK